MAQGLEKGGPSGSLLCMPIFDTMTFEDLILFQEVTYRVSENGLTNRQNALTRLIRRAQNPRFLPGLTLLLVTQRIFLNMKMQHRITSGRLLPVAEESLLLTGNV
jgi:hypothetical protein